jgi:thiol:disulfide interchange protein DsbD
MMEHRMKASWLVLVTAALFFWRPAPVAARGADYVHAQVELVSERANLEPGKPLWLGVRINSEPGWHIYWKNPGDSGMAPKIRWKLPPGFEVGEIQWPAPERIAIAPLVDFGYSGDTLLLTKLKVPDDLKAGQTVHLEAQIRYLICKNLCIPGKATASLDLVAHASPFLDKTPWAKRFAQARAQLPRPAQGWSSTATRDAGGVVLKLTPPKTADLRKLRGFQFYPDVPGIFSAAKQPSAQLRGQSLVFELPFARHAPADLREVSGILVDPGVNAEAPLAFKAQLEGAPPIAEGSTSSSDGSGSFRMFLLALLGGLILNLMPCVFPVLSVKILGFVQEASSSARRLRMHGLVFAAGVLVSFWALAAMLLLARSAGEGIGWGFQLQSPGFVAFLAALFLLMGLNLLGVFEVGTRWMGLGGKLASAPGLSGAFFSGVLATVVATPCTAPFMGAALGFALTAPAWGALLIFTGLALGMAAPYLVFAFLPGALAWLPRPGRWMESFKQFLAFPLFATVAWLIWTLGREKGVVIPPALLGGAVVLALVIWIVRRWGMRRGAPAAVAVLAVVGLGLGVSGAWSPRAGSLAWEPWSEARVAELHQKGEPIFVDFGAAWCITCQVNERVVFGSAAIRARFRELGIHLLQADWTNEDPAIASALQGYGRSGVPTYVLYPRGVSSKPVVLPEVLTPALLLENLRAADQDSSSAQRE